MALWRVKQDPPEAQTEGPGRYYLYSSDRRVGHWLIWHDGESITGWTIPESDGSPMLPWNRDTRGLDRLQARIDSGELYRIEYVEDPPLEELTTLVRLGRAELA